MRSLAIVLLLLLAACSAANESASYDDSMAEATAEEAMAEVTEDRALVEEEALRPFPLPAPRPSARVNLPPALFGQPATVGDIAARLEAALGTGGYEDFSYYSVPGGFALVTETERIYDDGRPYEEPARWTFEAAPLLDLGSIFSADFPAGFLARLRTADPGRYRVLVFLVTTRIQTTGSETIDVDAAQAWTRGGGDRLPRSVGQIAFGPDHNISVLVYEFRRASVAAEPRFVDPSGLTARAHMQATRLLRSE